MTTRWRWSPRRKCAPAAWPTRSAVSAVIGSLLVSPRMPSVPKNLRVIARALARLADPAPEARGHPADRAVRPGGEEEQQGAADQRGRSGIGRPPPEGHESRPRDPLVEALAHQLGLFRILAGRPAD